MSEFWKRVIIVLRIIAILLFVIFTVLTIIDLVMYDVEGAVRQNHFWLVVTMAILYAPYLLFRDKIKKQ